MNTPRLLGTLVLFFLLVTVQGPRLSDWFFPSKCPRLRENCEFRERDLCTKVKPCPSNQKCCVFSCGKKCIDPQQDICKLPKDSGPCMAYFIRWWYSKENNTCYSFVYGGCLGNNNNFQTQAICQDACQKPQTCPKIRVKCEVEERSECTRHRHCPDKMKCCLFNCGKKCLDLRKDVCSMPKETGPCLAFIPRWWYNKEREICTEFIYGGCNGNNNNFQTEAICLVICQDRGECEGPRSPEPTATTQRQASWCWLVSSKPCWDWG
ncbi:eppin isoform X2 [Oryctolagus cuniculus]|uniref:eppin isoform X2 n=1 Tax=Oryctolagus cuniculus TaxID=9986 RepID=UPI0038796BB7